MKKLKNDSQQRTHQARIRQPNEQQLEEVADLITSLKLRTQAIEKTPKKHLSEFYGVLHTAISYPGKEAIRQIVGETLAQKSSTDKS